MEILSQTVNTFDYWFYIIFGLALTFISGWTTISFCRRVIYRKDYRLSNLMAVVFTTCVTLLFVHVTVNSIHADKRITYKVKVTDWNVVHNGGYEIIEEDGQIATVEKIK